MALLTLFVISYFWTSYPYGGGAVNRICSLPPFLHPWYYGAKHMKPCSFTNQLKEVQNPNMYFSFLHDVIKIHHSTIDNFESTLKILLLGVE